MILVSLALILVLNFFVQVKSEEDNLLVHALTEETFAHFIEENPLSLVEFYAPWCGHCKKLAPKYVEAAKVLASDGIPLASVDCIAHEALYWSNNIKGYPTLLAFIGGDSEPITYDGPMETVNIVSFMRHLKTPVLVPVAGTITAISSFSSKYRTPSRPVVMIFVELKEETMKSWSNDAERSLDIVCRKLDLFACGVVRGEAAFHEGLGFNITSLPAFLIFPPLQQGTEDSHVVLEPSSAIAITELRSWVLANAFPPVVEFQEANMDLMFSPKRPGFDNHVLLFIDKKRHDSSLETAFHDQAIAFSGRCIFILVDLSRENRSEFTQNLLSDLNVSTDELDIPTNPRLIIIKSARTMIKFFDMEDEYAVTITGDIIQDFVNRFLNDQLEPSRVIEVPSP